MSTKYASLVGPLLGYYFPLPPELDTREKQGVALNTSRLQRLWCSIYDEAEVDKHIAEFGGAKLPTELARRLDYDSNAIYAIEQAQSIVDDPT